MFLTCPVNGYCLHVNKHKPLTAKSHQIHLHSGPRAESFQIKSMFQPTLASPLHPVDFQHKMKIKHQYQIIFSFTTSTNTQIDSNLVWCFTHAQGEAQEAHHWGWGTLKSHDSICPALLLWAKLNMQVMQVDGWENAQTRAQLCKVTDWTRIWCKISVGHWN